MHVQLHRLFGYIKQGQYRRQAYRAVDTRGHLVYLGQLLLSEVEGCDALVGNVEHVC